MSRQDLCGTESGMQRHALDGTAPCDRCRRAKAAADKERLDANDGAKRVLARRRSNAQKAACGELARRYNEEYLGYYRDRLARLRAGELSPAPTTRHGTAEGHARHLAEGTAPCAGCAAGKLRSDERDAAATPAQRTARLHARAQSKSWTDLRAAHEEEYREIYAGLLEGAGTRQPFKSGVVSDSTAASWSSPARR